jgi:hypothetical protein
MRKEAFDWLSTVVVEDGNASVTATRRRVHTTPGSHFKTKLIVSPYKPNQMEISCKYLVLGTDLSDSGVGAI